MATTAKKKPMTAREKKARAAVRADLRERGIIPQKKKPMNRPQFCREARETLINRNSFDFQHYLYWALFEKLEGWKDGTKNRERSPEAVGIARAIKLADRRMEFEKQRRDEGKEGDYTVKELYEACKDIFDA